LEDLLANSQTLLEELFIILQEYGFRFKGPFIWHLNHGMHAVLATQVSFCYPFTSSNWCGSQLGTPLLFTGV